MRGLSLKVYRSAALGDCTNGGVTAQADRLTLVGLLVDGKVEPLPQGCQVMEPGAEAPAVVLVPSRAPGYDATPHLVPLELIEGGLPPDHVGPMAGGNYAGSSDGRWSALGKLYGQNLVLDLVAVHDRVESYSHYLVLSQ